MTVLQVAADNDNSTVEINHSREKEDFESGGITFAAMEMKHAESITAVAQVSKEANNNDTSISPNDASEEGSNVDLKERHELATTAVQSERTINNDDGWKFRYSELLVFHASNGHSNVLRSDTNKRLSGWVKRQRNNFKAGKLSYTQIMLLNELDFVWNRLEHIWYGKYKMICNYSKQHSGHNCNVPCSFNRQLSEWTQKQRRDYGKKEKSMTSTRIDALEKVPGWSWISQCKPYIKKEPALMAINNNQHHPSLKDNDDESSSDTEVDVDDVVI
jgi:hypothetical protein